jgi:hypothetical protein
LRAAVKLNDKMKASLCKGFALYFLHTRTPNLFLAYRRTLARFFNIGYGGDGRPVMPPRKELPTFLQFRRFVTRIYGDPAIVGATYQARAKSTFIGGKFSAN